MTARRDNASAKLDQAPRAEAPTSGATETAADKRTRKRRLLAEAQQRALQNESNRRVLKELAKR